MANLYTSGLIEYTGTDPVEDSTAEFAHDGPDLTVERYTAGDVLIDTINPASSAIENHDAVNTRIRVYPEVGQVAVGEKLKFIVDDGA